MTNQIAKPNKSGGFGTMLVRRLLRTFTIIILAILVIILVAVVGLFVYEPSPAEGFAFSSAGKTIQLSGGRTLAYLDIGDPEGRPVFYFHGSPGSRLEGLMYDERSQQLGIRMIVLIALATGCPTFKRIVRISIGRTTLASWQTN